SRAPTSPLSTLHVGDQCIDLSAIEHASDTQDRGQCNQDVAVRRSILSQSRPAVNLFSRARRNIPVRHWFAQVLGAATVASKQAFVHVGSADVTVRSSQEYSRSTPTKAIDC